MSLFISDSDHARLSAAEAATLRCVIDTAYTIITNSPTKGYVDTRVLELILRPHIEFAHDGAADA